MAAGSLQPSPPPRGRFAAVVVAAAAAVACLPGCGSGDAAGTPAVPAAAFDRAAPNVVVVMTDDQALDTMRAMPKVRRLLGGGGTEFTDALVSFPLCCPSRASFLTGQYAHNHGVLDNGPPKGGIARLDQDGTLPVWLNAAGYRTGFIGKYLNGYGKNRNGGDRFIPPGWSDWHAATAHGKKSPYDYDLNENGELVRYGSEPGDYKTDVMADKAVEFIGGGSGERPFFLWVATSAPHTDNALPASAPRNPLPAPRHRGRFADISLPRPASFDERDVADKPRFVRQLPRIGARRQQEMRRQYVSELESLLAVDDLIGRVVAELRRSGELDETLIVFTSDNGYLRGQHRIDSGKSKLYDESLRVPLFVRGPGFAAGGKVAAPVVNVDLTATIVALAGLEPSHPLDGAPLQAASGPGGERRAVLTEVFERKQDRFQGIRTARYLYARHSDGETELYDRRHDPGELENLAGRPDLRNVRERLAARLERLADCAGAECRPAGQR